MKLSIPLSCMDKFNAEYNSWEVNSSLGKTITSVRHSSSPTSEGIFEIDVSDKFIDAHPHWAEFKTQ